MHVLYFNYNAYMILLTWNPGEIFSLSQVKLYTAYGIEINRTRLYESDETFQMGHMERVIVL